MTHLTLGCDPGVAGALASIDDKRELLSVEDLPVISDGATKWIDASALLQRLLELKAGRRPWQRRAAPRPS
jgi:hypothetical protein